MDWLNLAPGLKPIAGRHIVINRRAIGASNSPSQTSIGRCTHNHTTTITSNHTATGASHTPIRRYSRTANRPPRRVLGIVVLPKLITTGDISVRKQSTHDSPTLAINCLTINILRINKHTTKIITNRTPVLLRHGLPGPRNDADDPESQKNHNPDPIPDFSHNFQTVPDFEFGTDDFDLRRAVIEA